MLFAIWAKEGGPFIQMTHCLSALGGILAPLVTQPFVSQGSAEGKHIYVFHTLEVLIKKYISDQPRIWRDISIIVIPMHFIQKHNDWFFKMTVAIFFSACLVE